MEVLGSYLGLPRCVRPPETEATCSGTGFTRPTGTISARATDNQVEMQTAIGFFWALGFVAAAWHQIGFLVHPRNTSDT